MKYAIASLIVIATVSLAAIQSSAPNGKLEITTLSTDAALVTGGDVLVKVAAPAGVPYGDAGGATAGYIGLPASWPAGPVFAGDDGWAMATLQTRVRLRSALRAGRRRIRRSARRAW